MFEIRVKRATSLARVIDTDRIVSAYTCSSPPPSFSFPFSLSLFFLPSFFLTTIFFRLFDRSNEASKTSDIYPLIQAAGVPKDCRFERRPADSFSVSRLNSLFYSNGDTRTITRVKRLGGVIRDGRVTNSISSGNEDSDRNVCICIFSVVYFRQSQTAIVKILCTIPLVRDCQTVSHLLA